MLWRSLATSAGLSLCVYACDRQCLCARVCACVCAWFRFGQALEFTPDTAKVLHRLGQAYHRAGDFSRCVCCDLWACMGAARALLAP